MQTWFSGCFIHELWLILFWNNDNIWSAKPTKCLLTNSWFWLHGLLSDNSILQKMLCCTSTSTRCAVYLSKNCHTRSNITGMFWVNSHPPSTLCYSSSAFSTVVASQYFLAGLINKNAVGWSQVILWAWQTVCLHLPIIPDTCHSKLFKQWCYNEVEHHLARTTCVLLSVVTLTSVVMKRCFAQSHG
jgi:hypothetical protein